MISRFVCKYWKLEVLGDKSLAELGRGAFLSGLCEVGDLRALQWARSQGCPWTFEEGSVRDYNGQLSWQTAQLLIPASNSKNYDLLRWLVEEEELGHHLIMLSPQWSYPTLRAWMIVPLRKLFCG